MNAMEQLQQALSAVDGSYAILWQLVFAAFLGMLLGAERTIAGKSAGMRTYALVSLGAALFTIIGSIVDLAYLGQTAFDPARTLAAIVMGVGFIGTGLTVLHREGLAGLTTAAGIWVAAGIGIACGFHLYMIAAFTTFITLFVFTAVWFAERAVKRLSTRISMFAEESAHNGSA